tara:strand:+ start:215 stop:400 length:186 start_codon:yes stop_codon:yes gene_type:complete
MKNTTYYILTSILFIALIFVTGCEDDAILTPQNESECTGSYCSLNLPGIQRNNNDHNPKLF